MRQRTGLLTLALTLVAGLALAGCAGNVGGGSTSTPDSLTGSWELTSGSDAEGALAIGDSEVTLGFGETAGGKAACNGYFATIEGGPGEISVSGVGQTEMACLEPGVMELESRYLAALGAATEAEYVGGELVITGPDVELHFAETTAATESPSPGDPDKPVTGCDDANADGSTSSPEPGFVCPQ